MAKATRYSVASLLLLCLGIALGYALRSEHPYDTCERKYGVSAGYAPIDDYILECVWLLRNQPALR